MVPVVYTSTLRQVSLTLTMNTNMTNEHAEALQTAREEEYAAIEERFRLEEMEQEAREVARIIAIETNYYEAEQNDDGYFEHEKEEDDESSEWEDLWEEDSARIVSKSRHVSDKQRFVMFAASMNRQKKLNTDVVSVIGFFVRSTVRITFKFDSLTNRFIKKFITEIEADETEIKKTKSMRQCTAMLITDANSVGGNLKEVKESIKIIRGDMLHYHEFSHKDDGEEYYNVKRTLRIEEI